MCSSLLFDVSMGGCWRALIVGPFDCLMGVDGRLQGDEIAVRRIE